MCRLLYFTVDADLAAGRLTELFPDRRLAVPTPFNAVYYAGRAVSPKIRAFVDFLAEEWGRDTVFENRPEGDLNCKQPLARGV